jgi:hypothetical protein
MVAAQAELLIEQAADEDMIIITALIPVETHRY